MARIRRRALGVLQRLLPGVGRVIALARFHAPKQLAALPRLGNADWRSASNSQCRGESKHVLAGRGL